MKKTFLIILFQSFYFFSNSQVTNTYVYDGQGNLIGGTHIKKRPGELITLTDSVGNRFILDSLHINVIALNAKGDTLWKTDPWKDNKIEAYRTKRPLIVSFHLAKEERTDNKEVIWLVYNNTQFGTLDKTTGKFFRMGQD